VPDLPAPTSRTAKNSTSTSPDLAGAPEPLRIHASPVLRPFLIRPGARFDCFGDGLCCTDIHALGPVTRAEKKHLDLIEPGALVRHKDLMAPVFRTQPSGACVLRSERGCELHARGGIKAKPTGCSRFPFGLIATPEGGRITTEHRCPCRTLGERPELTVESAEPWLRDAGGKLSSNGRVGVRVMLSAGKRVGFSKYREWEREIISGLLALEDPFVVLEKKPIGKLDGVRWNDIAQKLRLERDGTAYGEALHWTGNALRALGGEKMELGPRPWAKSFDRAEARGKKTTAEHVLADWLADLVWSLDWVFATRNFDSGRRELATLYALGLQIVERLVRSRVRADRAAAEAVTILELTRQSELWEDVQRAL
jgi:hypothetical protein